MYIPEIEELQEIADSINIETCTPEQVVTIVSLRDSLQKLIESFNISSFEEGAKEALSKLIKTQKRTDEMMKVFMPYMTLFLLFRD
jgi:predicted nucleic acid-binding protein